MTTRNAAVAAITSRPYPESVEAPAGAGPNSYAIEVTGDALAPAVRSGQRVVFDPDAGPARRGDVVALWLHGASSPSVVKLATALPPEEVLNSDMESILGVEIGSGVRPVSMRRVAQVDRMIEAI